MENNIFDLIIIGGGPAGSAAAVYAARKRLKTALILKEWGGQSIVSEDIQNWIGTSHISGSELAKNLENHVKEYAGDVLEIKTNNLVIEVEEIEKNKIKIKLENGDEFFTKSLLIATGSNRRKLTIPGATQFENKGITYCASCDGPMFSGMDVVVIGGGNAGFESAAQLLAYCNSVTLLARSEIKAEKVTIDKLKNNPKFKFYTNTQLKEIKGNNFVEKIIFTDEKNTKVELNISGVFVEAGQIPSTEFVKNILELTKEGHIIIDPWTNRVHKDKFIWAAGDCTNILYHQNNIAAGEAVKAVEDIYKTLSTR